MTREAIPSWFFAVVVVRHRGRYLLVHEKKHGQLWYLPAGRVEAGELWQDGATRETLEETGVRIRLTRVIRVEHSVTAGSARVRVIFLAEPLDDPTPKSEADEHSLEAAWVSVGELGRYPLRGPDVEAVLRYVDGGGASYPMSVLALEGAKYD